MKSIASFALLLTCIGACHAVWLIPSILDPPAAQASICYSQTIENSLKNGVDSATPYLKCVNDAQLLIISAQLVVSDSTTCPLQFTNLADTPAPTCSSNNYANSNVTNILYTLCHGKYECAFSFDNFSPLICVINAPPTMTPIAEQFYVVNTVYKCQTPRRRFRPFSNKRYNFKFSRTINHPIRKMSYNRLQSL